MLFFSRFLTIGMYLVSFSNDILRRNKLYRWGENRFIVDAIANVSG